MNPARDFTDSALDQSKWNRDVEEMEQDAREAAAIDAMQTMRVIELPEPIQGRVQDIISEHAGSVLRHFNDFGEPL